MNFLLKSALIANLVLCLVAAGPVGAHWMSAVCVVVQHDHCSSSGTAHEHSHTHGDGGTHAHAHAHPHAGAPAAGAPAAGAPAADGGGCPESDPSSPSCPEDHHHSLSCQGGPVGLLGPIEGLLDPPDQDRRYLVGMTLATSSVTVSPLHRPPIG